MAQATTYPEESTAETITKWYLAKDSQPKKISQAGPACTGFAWLSAAKPPTSIKPDRQEAQAWVDYRRRPIGEKKASFAILQRCEDPEYYESRDLKNASNAARHMSNFTLHTANPNN